MSRFVSNDDFLASGCQNKKNGDFFRKEGREKTSGGGIESNHGRNGGKEKERERERERETKKTHHLGNLLHDALSAPLRQRTPVLPHRAHEGAQVIPQHLRREAQLPHRHPHNPHPLPVHGAAEHRLHHARHALHQRPQLRTRHQSPRPQNPPQSFLVDLRQAARLRDDAVELEFPALDHLEDLLLPDHRGARFACLSCRGRVRGADDGDLEVGFHAVRQPDLVANDGAVALGAQLEVGFVFLGSERPADFEGADVAGFTIVLR